MAAKLNYLQRLIATAISFTIFGIGGVFIALFMYPVILLFVSKPKQVKCGRLCIHYLFRFFIFFMKITGIYTYETNNIEKLQKSGYLVIANHPTLIDVVFLLSFIKDANCIVKKSLIKNPFMYGALKSANYIVNDEDPEIFLQTCANTLNNQQTLLIFPEGTRSNVGKLKFKRGAANIAILANKNILPIVIKCEPNMLSKGQKWYKIPPKRPHFTFSVYNEISIGEQETLIHDSENIHCKARQLTQEIQKFYKEELTS